MRPDWQDHIQRYADGRASPDEVAALQNALKEDSELRAQFLDYVNLDESLAAVAAARVELSRVEIDFRPKGVHFFIWPLRGIGRPILAAALAVLMVALGIWFGRSESAWATVVQVETGTTISCDGKVRVARIGERLRRDESVEVPGDSSAQVTVDGLGQILLGPEARLRRGRQVRQLELMSGFIEITAQKQRPGRPWLIRTEEAEAAVVGTKFSLATAHGRTAMRVEEGLVHLTALESGRSEDVGGGNRAYVDNDAKPEVARTRQGSVLLLTSRIPADNKWNRFNQMIGDKFVGSRLWQLGFRVETRHFDEVQTHDLVGRALVIVSLFEYGVGEPALERIHLSRAPVPVVCLEPAAYPVLKMTGAGQGTDHGFKGGPSSVEILLPDHPLAGGLRGVSDRLFREITSWGSPGPGALVIARLPARSDQAVLFAYESGRALVTPLGMPLELAPARRVGLFLDPFAVTQDEREVWQLFEASVDWCVSTEGIR
jgi:ferric-dicitrate binding protein FerR (iron transport regulator)